jgi:hypothetical protein
MLSNASPPREYEWLYGREVYMAVGSSRVVSRWHEQPLRGACANERRLWLRPLHQCRSARHREMDETEHEKRGEPERDPAQHVDCGDGVANRGWLRRVAEAGGAGDHAGDCRAERGAERAHRGQRRGKAALFEGLCAAHRACDQVHVVDANAEPHQQRARREQHQHRLQCHQG